VRWRRAEVRRGATASVKQRRTSQLDALQLDLLVRLDLLLCHVPDLSRLDVELLVEIDVSHLGEQRISRVLRGRASVEGRAASVERRVLKGKRRWARGKSAPLSGPSA
jgi:hypothetical protein